MTDGKFITFEGIDGAGKSSHLLWLAETLRARGFEVVVTREPGETPVGSDIREIVLKQAMDRDTEMLLFFAARCENLARVIVPALHRGAWVVCDRFTDSTYAYQCGGRGLDAARVAVLEQWVHADRQPDLTLLFDTPIEVARDRLDQATADPDKFEREQAAFFSRVRAMYLSRADAFPGRIRVVNGARSIAAIRVDVLRLVEPLIPR